MNLLQPKLRTKEDFIKHFREWDQQGRIGTIRPSLVLGSFYSRYRLRYGALPITEVHDDLHNLEQFMRMYLADDPSLALYVVDVLFNLKNFNGISTNALLNKNILINWGIVERAAALRKKPKHGEQSEFQSDGPGTICV